MILELKAPHKPRLDDIETINMLFSLRIIVYGFENHHQENHLNSE